MNNIDANHYNQYAKEKAATYCEYNDWNTERVTILVTKKFE